jgi:DNA-binding CsgD family transcriptional regulator
MLQSREPADVSKWLLTFPNIAIVSRDGSTAYAAAISTAHAYAVQISDRFHLIKNLHERVGKVFHRIFENRISIPLTGKTAEREIKLGAGNRAVKIETVKKMYKEGRSREEIQALTGITPKTIKKYIALSPADIPIVRPDSREKEHLDAVTRLKQKVELVTELRARGMSIQRIGQKTALNRATVKSYLRKTFIAVNGQYGKRREGKLAPFREMVLNYTADGLSYPNIYEIIRERGYTGGPAALRAFVARERRIYRDAKERYGAAPVELLDKGWLLKLMYRPIEKVHGITKEQLAAVIKAYPLAGDLFQLIDDFKNIMKDCRPRRLHWWIKKAAALHIDEIDHFLVGIKNDLSAVKNGIAYYYNNGTAEGYVNKVKVIKRIMYGRCGFDLLRKKVLKIEKLKKIN